MPVTPLCDLRVSFPVDYPDHRIVGSKHCVSPSTVIQHLQTKSFCPYFLGPPTGIQQISWFFSVAQPSFCPTHPRILAASASNSLRRLSCSKRRRSTAPSVTVSGPNQRFKSLSKNGRKMNLAAHVDSVVG